MAQETLSTVERTFSVLEQLAHNGAMGVRELHSVTGLSVTTVHRILSTLVVLGYVQKQSTTERYELTYKLLVLGHSITEHNSIVKAVHPYLEQLSQQCKETVHFVERLGNNIRYIDKVLPTEGIIATGSYLGMELPMYSTAVGKSILADLSDAEIKKIWEESEIIKFTENTITTEEDLFKEIERTRLKGFAIDNEEREEGLFCIAMDIFDVKSKPSYAVSISAPVLRMMGDNLLRNIELLGKLKKELTNVIGYSI